MTGHKKAQKVTKTWDASRLLRPQEKGPFRTYEAEFGL